MGFQRIAPTLVVCLGFNGFSFAATQNEPGKDGSTVHAVKKTFHLDPQVAPTEQLDWEEEIWCVQDEADGQEYRVSCREQKGAEPYRCLVAPNQTPSGAELSRTQSCLIMKLDEFKKRLNYRTFEQIPAIAEAPPGWMRDDQQRVFQVTFDLMDRFYLGAGWMPSFDLTKDSHTLDRVRLDMGFSASLLDQDEAARHNFRAVEGWVALTDLEASGLLFSYDYSHRSNKPVLWITTFLGRPVRHDLYLDLGLGVRLLDLRTRPHGMKNATDLEFGEAHGAWDIWQSDDMYNQLRLEAGVGISQLFFGTRGVLDLTLLSPGVRLLGHFALDQDGFYNLGFNLHWKAPLVIAGGNLGKNFSRPGAQVSYEMVLLAVNDQPLTLAVEAALDYRDDLGALASKWDVTAMVGLRFSLWAPARVHVPVDPKS